MAEPQTETPIQEQRTWSDRFWDGYAQVNAKLKDWLERIPAWMPIIPAYLQFKIQENEAFTALVTGKDPVTGEPLEAKARLKRAAALEAQALLHGGQAALEAVIILADPEVSPTVTRFTEQLKGFTQRDGEKKLVDTLTTSLGNLAAKVDQPDAKPVLTRVANLITNLASQPEAKQAMAQAIKNHPAWQTLKSHIKKALASPEEIETFFARAKHSATTASGTPA